MKDPVWCHKSDLAVVESPLRVSLIDLERLDLPPRILEGPAAVIWQAIDGTRHLTEVTAHVAAEFDMNPEEISADVDNFVAALVRDDLIESRSIDDSRAT